MKKTKIICTLGPATDKIEIVEALIANGMNVARFNFSHGKHSEHAERISLARAAGNKLGQQIALLADTKGPEMRLGMFKESSVELREGEKFTLTTKQDVLGDQYRASVNYVNLAQEINVGTEILLADGLINLKVLTIEDTEIHTVVQNTGSISSRKRVAVPGAILNLPFLSEQDVQDILFAIEHDMDYIAASFVQKAADVLAIRKVLEENNSNIGIISKIENSLGVENIEEIISVSDGIMVARGDLGVEIPAEEVPLVQKSIIAKCNKLAKPVITATQMLESMVKNPRPTRAEASDVANAILDGSDAIMLSGETASGDYPVEAVKTMATIAKRTETALEYEQIMRRTILTVEKTTTEAVSQATAQIAHNLGATAILTATESGYTPRMISKYRPRAKIVAVTPLVAVARKMQLYWGVYPVVGKSNANTDQMVEQTISLALKNDFVKEGDLTVITAGVPVGIVGSTNMIRVHIVGNVILQGTGIGRKVAHGKVCIINEPEDFASKFVAGDILVVKSLMDDYAKFAVKASAIIAEEDGLTSAAAIVGVSFGITTIVGVNGAVEQLEDGAIITVDPERGRLYQGHINAK